VEEVDPDTGEVLGVRWQRLDAAGEPVGETGDAPTSGPPAKLRRQGNGTLRIGVVVPLSSLLTLGEAPGELVDRSGLVPAEQLRQAIAEALGPDPDGCDDILFTRLLADDEGRLLDTTELGRFASARLAEAVRIRAGTWTRSAADTTGRRRSPGSPPSATTMRWTGPCRVPSATAASMTRSPPDPRDTRTQVVPV
jgi:hypothetical protein